MSRNPETNADSSQNYSANHAIITIQGSLSIHIPICTIHVDALKMYSQVVNTSSTWLQ